MTYLERMFKGEDICAITEATWGPMTEFGYPVAIKVYTDLKHGKRNKGYCLSMSGSLLIKECKRLGLEHVSLSCQCTDIDKVLAKFGLFSPTLDRMVAIWKKWHLNDMSPGTEAQEMALDKLREKCEHPSYDHSCIYLMALGLLEDKNMIVDGKPYKYGSGWIFREIPNDVLVDICGCLDSGIIIMNKEEK